MDIKFTFTIYYITGWSNPMFHYKNSSFKWETLPLSSFNTKKNLFFINIVSSTKEIEFVFKQHHSDLWDNNNSNNYKILNQGDYIINRGKINPINQINNLQKIIVFSDLDGTLLGDREAIKAFNSFWLSNCYFDKNKLLIYNSGRNFKSIYQLFSETNILYPDFIISSSGNEIHYFDPESSEYKPDTIWYEKSHLDFNSEIVINELTRKFNFLNDNSFDGGRVSYGVKTHILENNVNELKKFVNYLENNHNLKIKFIISGEGDYKFLDFLSTHTGKGEAALYVCKLLGFPIENSLAFGDSMNDTEMLQMCGKSFMVGNSQIDLRKWFEEIKNKDNIKISNKNYAWAILDEVSNILK